MSNTISVCSVMRDRLFVVAAIANLAKSRRLDETDNGHCVGPLLTQGLSECNYAAVVK